MKSTICSSNNKEQNAYNPMLTVGRVLETFLAVGLGISVIVTKSGKTSDKFLDSIEFTSTKVKSNFEPAIGESLC